MCSPCCHASLLGPSLSRCFLAWVSLRVLIDLACSVGNAQALLLRSVFGSSFLQISYFYLFLRSSPFSFSGELSGFVQTPLDPSITDSPHSLAVAISQIRVVRFPSGSIVRIGDPPHPHPGPLVAMQAINRPHDSDYERRNTKKARWL